MQRRSLTAPGALALALLLSPVAATAGTFTRAAPGELDALEARIRATRFLAHATFGPTRDGVARLADRVLEVGARAAFEEWIDAQLALPPTLHHALAKQMIRDDGLDDLSRQAYLRRYPVYAWWQAALAAPDQLRQRTAWALAQVFVINREGPGLRSVNLDGAGEPQYLGVVDYYDLLVRNAFGDYRTTLHQVALHPVMGVFLSHLHNARADPARGRYPDENFAREVMEAFSIGLDVLEPDGTVVTDDAGVPVPTYTNDDVRELARVFTGLDWEGTGPRWERPVNFHQPMAMFEELHDTGTKRLVGGVSLPAGQPGMRDIAAALDHLAAHPNVGPYVGRLLIQRFVTSNPSPAYVAAVASAFRESGGAFAPVLRAILLHPEALDSPPITRSDDTLTVGTGDPDRTRVVEPVLRYAAFLRAFDPVSTHPSGRLLLPGLWTEARQEVYQAPDVFNFYRHDHLPAGELTERALEATADARPLVAPELQIATPAAVVAFYHRLRREVRQGRVILAGVDASGPSTWDLRLRFDREDALGGDPEALVQHLDLLLCRGELGDPARATLADALLAAESPVDRSRAAIVAVLMAPECTVDG